MGVNALWTLTPSANWFGAKTWVPNCFDIKLQHQTVLEVKRSWKSKLGRHSALDFETLSESIKSRPKSLEFQVYLARTSCHNLQQIYIYI